MKTKFYIFFTCLIFFISCKSHLTPEQEHQKAKEEAQRKTDSLAAPLIANDIADLDIMLIQIEDTKQSLKKRLNGYYELTKRFPEYLFKVDYFTPPPLTGKCAELARQKDDVDHILSHPKAVLEYYDMNCDSAALKMQVDSVLNSKFQAAVILQKVFIKQKWTNAAAAQVYKDALQKQIEAEQELEREKNK